MYYLWKVNLNKTQTANTFIGTSLVSQVISSQWDGVLGSCDVIVTSEHVTPGDLSVQVVGGLGMSINASPAHPAVVTATVTAYNILYQRGQVSSVFFLTH